MPCVHARTSSACLYATRPPHRTTPHHTRTFHPWQVRDVLRAGVDLDCSGELLQRYAESAMRDGAITEEDIDGALRTPHPFGPSTRRLETRRQISEPPRTLGLHASRRTLSRNSLPRPPIGAGRSLRVRMRLAHFDPPSPLAHIDAATTICSADGRRLARSGAAQVILPPPLRYLLFL